MRLRIWIAGESGHDVLQLSDHAEAEAGYPSPYWRMYTLVYRVWWCREGAGDGDRKFGVGRWRTQFAACHSAAHAASSPTTCRCRQDAAQAPAGRRAAARPLAAAASAAAAASPVTRARRSAVRRQRRAVRASPAHGRHRHDAQEANQRRPRRRPQDPDCGPVAEFRVGPGQVIVTPTPPSSPPSQASPESWAESWTESSSRTPQINKLLQYWRRKDASLLSLTE